MDRIKQIWTTLELNNSDHSGLVKIRYSELSKCDIFLGLKLPENYRMLIIKAPFNIGKDFKFQFEFRGLKFDKIYDPDESNYLLLNLILIDDNLKDIYDTLLYDILSSIGNEPEIKVVFNNYTKRLLKWQSLFEKFNSNGLSPEEQRCLFGELFFLRKFLLNNSNFQTILTSWIGVSKEVRDFQYNNWAVEVKTTIGNNHQKVQISSERQLDNTHLEQLYLYHISLDKALESGESLPQIIASVYSILEVDIIALNTFKAKLYEAGYFEQHQGLYSSIGYHIRQDHFYLVENDFPRIQENELRSGVGDVKYSIILSQCQEYLQSEIQVFENLPIL